MLTKVTRCTWDELNEVLMRCDEKEAGELLKHATKKGWPTTYRLRIHSRLNKLRAERERAEIVG